jgi:hypothetical protein
MRIDRIFYTSTPIFQTYVIPVNTFEAIGIILLIGPLVLTLGGIFYAAITDAYKGSRPLASQFFRSHRRARDDAEKERSQEDSEVWSYIKELRKRIR